jgi:ketosteroid isomerase-like protein|tara:strand:- start:502 stop:960 length:459 start_codon:yes stop_codon:yes gene_type:complete
MKRWLHNFLYVGVILFSAGLHAENKASEEIRQTIQEHYGLINAADYEGAAVHHRGDFTMYFPDGGPLWESDYEEVAARMKATPNFPESMNLLMSNYRASVYGDWAIVTFYLSGTHTRGGESQNVVNRVSAVWIKENGIWLEAHHHESPLNPL